jgi:hypothetical protein
MPNFGLHPLVGADAVSGCRGSLSPPYTLMPIEHKASVVHVAPVFFNFFTFLRVLVFCLIDIA